MVNSSVVLGLDCTRQGKVTAGWGLITLIPQACTEIASSRHRVYDGQSTTPHSEADPEEGEEVHILQCPITSRKFFQHLLLKFPVVKCVTQILIGGAQHSKSQWGLNT